MFFKWSRQLNWLRNNRLVTFESDERHEELQAKHDISILELQDQLEVANDHETTLSK